MQLVFQLFIYFGAKHRMTEQKDPTLSDIMRELLGLRGDVTALKADFVAMKGDVVALKTATKILLAFFLI